MKLEDNSKYEKSELKEKIPNITKKLLNMTLKQLGENGIFVFSNAIEDAEDIEEDQKIIRSDGDSYRTGNVMGFFGYKEDGVEESLVIRSRFSSDDNDCFFRYLLHKVFDMPTFVDLRFDTNHDNDLFNLLIFLFPVYLKAAMRKGLFKQYTRRKYSDANVRGTVDIARHIKQNTPFLGKIAYNQREFSCDNPLMELVRHTVEFIKSKRYGNQLLFKVKDEVGLVISATSGYKHGDRQRIIEANKKNGVRHAYYHEYRDLQMLCILILTHRKSWYGDGKHRAFGILFDGSWLWEEYVKLLIKEDFHHPRNKARNKKEKNGQKLFSDSRKNIYPDFIGENSENRIIADAKYKPAEYIAREDNYQVLAYMFRFDAKTGFFLYPKKSAGEDAKVRYLNKGTTFEKNVAPRDDVRVIKLGLEIPKVPKASDYNSFVDQIKKNEERFRTELAALSKGKTETESNGDASPQTDN